MNYPIMSDPVPGDPTALQAWAKTYSDMANGINDAMRQLDGALANLIGAGPESGKEQPGTLSLNGGQE